MSEFLHKDLSYAIIGAAMEVHNELHLGLDEKLYEKALIIELTSRGLTVETQRQFPVHYKGQFIGKLIPDLIVNNSIIVETKVVDQFHPSHYSQLKGYLNIANLKVGLLLNFKNQSLQHDRFAINSTSKPPNLQK